MNYDYLTNAELIRTVDSAANITPLERLLVTRLVSAMQDIEANLRRLHDDPRQTLIDFTGFPELEARNTGEVRAGAVQPEQGDEGSTGTTA